jgi:hypothetical protein
LGGDQGELSKSTVLKGHAIEVLNVKVGVFILLLELLFASLPYCSQNHPALSDTLRLLSDF